MVHYPFIPGASKSPASVPPLLAAVNPVNSQGIYSALICFSLNIRLFSVRKPIKQQKKQNFFFRSHWCLMVSFSFSIQAFDPSEGVFQPVHLPSTSDLPRLLCAPDIVVCRCPLSVSCFFAVRSGPDQVRHTVSYSVSQPLDFVLVGQLGRHCWGSHVFTNFVLDCSDGRRFFLKRKKKTQHKYSTKTFTSKSKAHHAQL